MTRRSLLSVTLLTVFTFGIYTLHWLVETKTEMNQRGGEVPSVWWIVVPFGNLYFMWKYSEAVERVTGGFPQLAAMALAWIVGPLSLPVFQHEFNKLAVQEQLPEARLV